MIIRINAKKMIEALEDSSLKGKYYNGAEAKNGKLSDFAFVETETAEQIVVYNADHTTVCKISVEVEDIDYRESRLRMTKHSTVVFDIDKTIKYLKPFGDTTVEMQINDYITIVNDVSTAKLPMVLTHPAMAMIDRFKQFTLPKEGMPTFGKTTFESKTTILSEELSLAVNACDAVNNAKYKFDAAEDGFVISSKRNDLDMIETTVDSIEQIGECATVEFTGQFHKFMKATVTIYMKDDAPVLFVSRNRMLLKAPYLER